MPLGMDVWKQLLCWALGCPKATPSPPSLQRGVVFRGRQPNYSGVDSSCASVTLPGTKQNTQLSVQGNLTAHHVTEGQGTRTLHRKSMYANTVWVISSFRFPGKHMVFDLVG